MILLLPLLLQSSGQLADIQLGAKVRAQSVTIEKRGDARLTVSSSPEGANVVDVRAPDATGRKALRNVEVNVRAEVRIQDPLGPVAENRNDRETALPQ